MVACSNSLVPPTPRVQAAQGELMGRYWEEVHCGALMESTGLEAGEHIAWYRLHPEFRLFKVSCVRRDGRSVGTAQRRAALAD